MLFPDITCTVEKSLKQNMEYGVYDLVEADLVQMVTVYKKTRRLEINGEVQLGGVDREVVSRFLERHIDEFLAREVLSNVYFEGLYFHMTSWKEAKPFIAFGLLCRQAGPFRPDNLQWIDIYTHLNNRRIVLENTVTQDQEYLTSVIDSSGAGIVVLGADGEVRSANAIAQRMFWIDSDRRLSFESSQAEEQFHEVLCHVLQTGQRHSLKGSYLRKRKKQQVLAMVISPLRNGKERIVGVVIVATDITENQLLSFEVEQLRQYGMLGEISLGLAHDIKNPLASIQGCARLLSKPNVEGAAREELTNIIQHEVGRVNDVVTQMLAYGDISKLQQESMVDINGVLRNCGNIIERQKLKRNIRIFYHLADRLPKLSAKEVHIQQLFLNLMLNSMQAISQSGEIFVESWYEKPEEMLCVKIQDTGAGMSAEVQSNAFDPYFTTKEAGTGMGLFVVKRTLETYGGDISLTSEPGLGTICIVKFTVAG